MFDKEKLRKIFQFSLLVGMTFNGFWYTYLYTWFQFGLPVDWYMCLITVALGALSTDALFRWIARN